MSPTLAATSSFGRDAEEKTAVGLRAPGGAPRRELRPRTPGPPARRDFHAEPEPAHADGRHKRGRREAAPGRVAERRCGEGGESTAGNRHDSESSRLQATDRALRALRYRATVSNVGGSRPRCARPFAPRALPPPSPNVAIVRVSGARGPGPVQDSLRRGRAQTDERPAVIDRSAPVIRTRPFVSR